MIAVRKAEFGKKNIAWQLQEVKAMFSEVVKAAVKSPQTITVRGRETAVILSAETYKKLVRPKQSLFQFIQDSPLRDFNLELPPRTAEEMREVNL